MKPRIILCLTLVLSGILFGCKSPSHPVVNNQNSSRKTIIKTPWKSQKINLYSLAGELTVVDAKKTRIEFTEEGFSHELRILIFVNPKTGNVWVGRDTDFYFENTVGITGGWLGGCILNWDASLIPKTKQEEKLDDVVNRFVTKTPHWKLWEPDADSETFTDLKFVLSTYFFSPFENSSAPGAARLKKFGIKDRAIQLDLESPWGPKGSVWISLDTHEILKAVENGKQTFPKLDAK